MFDFFGSQYIEKFKKGRDSGIIPDWKSVIAYVEGQRVLIYPKERIEDVQFGDLAIPYGYKVFKTVITNGSDGLVICYKSYR